MKRECTVQPSRNKRKNKRQLQLAAEEGKNALGTFRRNMGPCPQVTRVFSSAAGEKFITTMRATTLELIHWPFPSLFKWFAQSEFQIGRRKKPFLSLFSLEFLLTKDAIAEDGLNQLNRLAKHRKSRVAKEKPILSQRKKWFRKHYVHCYVKTNENGRFYVWRITTIVIPSICKRNEMMP